jgi:hypothetical protein
MYDADILQNSFMVGVTPVNICNAVELDEWAKTAPNNINKFSITGLVAVVGSSDGSFFSPPNSNSSSSGGCPGTSSGPRDGILMCDGSRIDDDNMTASNPNSSRSSGIMA